jgi:hypothetical protein
MLAFRSGVSALVGFVVRSFSTTSRPGLRAAGSLGLGPCAGYYHVDGAFLPHRTTQGGAVGLSLSSPVVGFVLFVLLFVAVPVALAQWAQARQRSRGPLGRRDWEDDPGRGAEHAVNDAIGRGITGGHG